MNKITLAATLLALSSMTVAAQANPLTVSATVPASASITLSSSSFAWASVTDNSTQYLPSDGGAITITGSIATSSVSGAGSVSVTAPANLTGTTTTTDILPISALSLTCSGTGNTGTNAAPTYKTQQALQASATTACATWGAGTSANLNFSLAMFLDDRSIPVDSYTSSGFAVVASAT